MIISEPAPAKTRILTNKFSRTFRAAQGKSLCGENFLDSHLLEKFAQPVWLAINLSQVPHLTEALVYTPQWLPQ